MLCNGLWGAAGCAHQALRPPSFPERLLLVDPRIKLFSGGSDVFLAEGSIFIEVFRVFLGHHASRKHACGPKTLHQVFS